MNWRVVSASEIGTSHIANGSICEDSCWAQVALTAGGLPFLSMFVADGAGSAARGGDGAELAIQAAATFVKDKLTLTEFGLSDELATECILSIREKIHAAAMNEGLQTRDFACTFLGVLSFKLGTLVIQIGDGAVVVDVGNGLEVSIIPMSGEYANMTHFVTDEDAIRMMITKTYPSVASRVAVFSDGLQRMALNMADNTVHEPFFTPFFNVLASVKPDQEDELSNALVRFLSGAAVNERTDDDKTLALAVMVE